MEVGVEAVRTARGSVNLIGQSVLNAALGLFLFTVMARFVSVEEMGVYATLIFTSSLLRILGIFGLVGAAARFVPRLLGKGSRSEASAAAFTILVLALFTSILASTAYYLLAPYFSIHLTKSSAYVGLFQFATIIVFFDAIALVLDGLLQGLQKFNSLVVIRVAAHVARVLFTVALLFSGYRVLGVLVGWVIWGVAGSIMALLPVFKGLKFHGSYSPKEIVTFSAPLLGANLLQFASSYIDLYITMFYLLPTDVGVYNVAITVTSGLSMIFFPSLQATILPAMSKAFGKGGMKSVEDMLPRVSRYVAYLFVPASLGLGVLAWPMVRLMAGRMYGDAVIPVVVITILGMTQGFSLPVIVGLQAIGKTLPVFRIVGVALGAGAAICLVAVPFLGILGSSLGRTILFAVTLAYGIFESRRLMTVRFDLAAVGKSLIAGGCMASFLFALQYLNKSVYLLPLYISSGFLVYVTGLKILRAIDSYDLMMVETTLPSFMRWVMIPLRKFFRVARSDERDYDGR